MIWESPYIPFNDAAAVWAAAAGTAGAYLPAAFRQAAAETAAWDLHRVRPAAFLEEVLTEAARRAAWRDRREETPAPREALIVDGMLLWHTRCRVALVPAGPYVLASCGWQVRISGPEGSEESSVEERIAAAGATLRELVPSLCHQIRRDPR